VFHKKDLIRVSKKEKSGTFKVIVTHYNKIINGTDCYFVSYFDLAKSSLVFLEKFSIYKTLNKVLDALEKEYNRQIRGTDEYYVLIDNINKFISFSEKNNLCIREKKEDFEDLFVFKNIEWIDEVLEKTATIELTDFCNERCIYCYKGDEQKRAMIDFNSLKNFMYKLKIQGVQWITFTGGGSYFASSF